MGFAYILKFLSQNLNFVAMLHCFSYFFNVLNFYPLILSIKCIIFCTWIKEKIDLYLMPFFFLKNTHFWSKYYILYIKSLCWKPIYALHETLGDGLLFSLFLAWKSKVKPIAIAVRTQVFQSWREHTLLDNQ